MKHILGVFTDGETSAAAIVAIQRDGIAEIEVFSPAPNHAIAQALRQRVSPVRLFTLIGGLLGCASGFALPIYTVLDWPLITGGMPIISIPPFVVIAFELTILFGAIGGFMGFLLLAGLPRVKKLTFDDPRFTNDRFGVLVRCTVAQAEAVRRRLEQAGAEEVTDHA